MFSEKVVLITDAYSGIGAATAKQFAEHGATLVLTGRIFSSLKKVATDCSSVVSLLLTGDLSSETESKAIVYQTIEHFGKLDVLINNADQFEVGGLESTLLEDYDRIFDLNLRAIYNLTSLAVPHLIKAKGNIVNVSSVSAMVAYPDALAYCVSKAALDQFTRCTAIDLASKNVRVNSVNPPVTIWSPERRSSISETTYDAFVQRSKELFALDNFDLSEEVAKSIVFLATDDASFITGATISIDGGMHMHPLHNDEFLW